MKLYSNLNFQKSSIQLLNPQVLILIRNFNYYSQGERNSLFSYLFRFFPVA